MFLAIGAGVGLIMLGSTAWAQGGLVLSISTAASMVLATVVLLTSSPRLGRTAAGVSSDSVQVGASMLGSRVGRTGGPVVKTTPVPVANVAAHGTPHHRVTVLATVGTSPENDDPSAERMGRVWEAVGLSDQQVIPWNAYPWHAHEKHPNGQPSNLVDDRLEPLKAPT